MEYTLITMMRTYHRRYQQLLLTRRGTMVNLRTKKAPEALSEDILLQFCSEWKEKEGEREREEDLEKEEKR